MSRGDYESIPDVELGGNSFVVIEKTRDPREVYPNVSEAEAELLVTLDDFKEATSISLDIPLVHSKDVTVNSSLTTMLIMPTLVVGVLVGVSIYVGTLNPHLFLTQIFPYAAVAIMFAVTAVVIDSRFDGQASFVVDAISHGRDEARNQIEQIVKMVRQGNDDVQNRLEPVLTTFQTKIKENQDEIQTLLENDVELMKEQANSDITTIATDLQNAHRQVKISGDRVQQNMTFDLPSHYTSITSYKCRKEMPILVACFFLQLIGLLLFVFFYPDNTTTTTTAAAATTNNNSRFLEQVVDDDSPLTIRYLVLLLVSFLLAILQLCWVASFTSADSLTDEINYILRETIQTSARETSQTEGFVHAMDKVLCPCLETIQTKILHVIRVLKRVDEIKATTAAAEAHSLLVEEAAKEQQQEEGKSLRQHIQDFFSPNN